MSFKIAIPLLASAARTVDTPTIDSDDVLFTPNAQATQGLLLLVDVTASGGVMLLSPRLQAQEPAALTWLTVWQSAIPIAAIGGYSYYITHHFRDGDVTPNSLLITELFTFPLFGMKWRFQMNHGNANSQTYSMGAYWIA